MTDLIIRVRADGTAEVARGMRNVDQAVGQMGGKAGAASQQMGKLGATSGVARQGLASLHATAGTATGGLLAMTMRTTGLVAGLAGVGLGIKGAVTAFVDYDSTMRRVGAITGATEDQMASMRDMAQELGATTKFSTGQAAEGFQFLGMAGLDAEQALAALPGVLQLAAAGALDLGTAADISTNILSGYGLEIAELSRVNDVLAKAFTSSNTNLQQLGTAFATAGPVAAAAGQEFEVTTAILGLMANAGFAGERSGTALRGALARLLDPTTEVTATLARLGVEIEDSAGNLRSLDDLMIELASTGLSAGDAIKLFGQEAGPAMLAAIRQGEGAIVGMVEKMRNAEGTAETVAGALKGALGGALTELSSAAEGAGIAFVDAFDETLVVGLQVITSTVQGAAGVLQQHQEIVLAVGLAYSGLAIIRTAVIPAISLLSTTVLPAATAALTTTAGAAAALRTTLAFLTGPAGILAAVATGVYLVATRQDEHKQAVDLAKTANEQLNQVLSDSTQTMSTAAQSTIALSREKLNQAKATLAQAEAEEGLLATLDEANEVFGRTDDARSRAAARLAELRKEVDALEANLGKATNRMMEQGPALRNASQAYGGLTIGINRAAEGMDRARAQYDEASQAAQQHAEQVEDLKNMLRAGLIDQGEYTAELERATESLRLVEGATELYEASLETATRGTKGMTGATREKLTELQKAALAYDDMRSGIEASTRESERLLDLITTENLSREQAATLIELENAARQAGVEVTAEQREEVLGLVAEMERNQQAVAELTTTTEQAAKEQERAWKQLGDSIQSNLSDAFVNLIDNGLSSFRDLFDTVKQWFVRFLADLAAAALAQPIMLAIGATGIGGLINPALAGMPGGDMLGLATQGASLFNAGSTVAGWLGIGGSAAAGTAGIVGGSASAAAGIGGNLGALGGSSFGAAGAGGWASTVAAALPWVAAAGAVLALVGGGLFEETPPRAFVVGDAASGEILQQVEKKGQDAAGLIELLDSIVEATGQTLEGLGGQLAEGRAQFDLHINPDRLRLTFVPGSGWADRLALDIDPEDSAAVADGVAKMVLAAATEADFSAAAEPIGAFFESLSLDMVEALPAGVAEQIIGVSNQVGESAALAAEALPWIGESIRFMAETADMSAEQLAGYTLALINIGEVMQSEIGQAASQTFPWLSQAIRDTAETADMSAEDLQTYSMSLIAIGHAMSESPAETYRQHLEDQNKTLLQNLSEQGAAVTQLALEYDGSAESAAALAGGVTQLKQSAVQALMAIDQARQIVDQSIESTRQSIETSLMSNAEKVDYWLGEAERVQAELAQATDPAEIARLTQEYTTALGQAWNFMDEDRRKQEQAWFIGMLNQADETAGTALDEAAATVHQIWIDAAGTVETKLIQSADQLHLAANDIRSAAAAIEQAIPSHIPVTVTVQNTSPHDQPGGGKARGGFVHAASGWIGHAAQRGLDSIPVMVGAGEAVINAWQQRWIEPALRAMYGFGLDGLFARETRPHSSAPSVAPHAPMPMLMAGGGPNDMRLLAAEIRMMRQEQAAASIQIAKNTGKTWRRLDRWDLDGLPPERT